MERPIDLEVSAVFKRAWALFVANLGPVLGATLIVFGVNLLLAVVQELLGRASGGAEGRSEALLSAANVAVTVISMIAGVFLNIGFLRICLKAVREESPSLADLFTGGPRLLNALIANLLAGVAVGLGFLLLIVPGVILALGWSLSLLLIADRNLGPIDALKESWRLTQGRKAWLFVYVLACLGLAVLGVLACCVGLAVAWPLCLLGLTLIYCRLAKEHAM